MLSDGLRIMVIRTLGHEFSDWKVHKDPFVLGTPRLGRGPYDWSHILRRTFQRLRTQDDLSIRVYSMLNHC